MKKTAKKTKKLLTLGKETIKKLTETELKDVAGGGSCLPPPPVDR